MPVNKPAVLALLFGTILGCDGEGKSSSEDPASSPVSDDCLALLSCVTASDPDNAALYEGTYGEYGGCWSGTDAEALACTQECQEDFAAQQLISPEAPECWVDGQPDAQVLFAAAPVWRYLNTDGDCYDMTATNSAGSSGLSFSAVFEFTSGFALPLDCELSGPDLGFSCAYGDDLEQYTLTGSFDEAFQTSDLFYEYVNHKYDYVSFDCTFSGTPQ